MMKIFGLVFFLGLSLRMTGQENLLVAGKVIENIKCQTNEKQSYALYLPKKYNKSATWPVIFFYDPAARGSLPVSLYSSLAEKYQCILVGSNNSRNGPFDVVQESEQAVVRDIESKLSIDKSRLFLSGFSGGARASVFLSMQRKIYAGIIACGAAFPPTGKLSAKDNIPFVEIVGNQDMNFTEAIDAENYLKGINYPHSLIFFQGTHSWPPVTAFDQAIFWQLYRSKPPTKSLAASYDSSVLAKGKQEMESGDLLLAHWNLSNSISFSPKIDSLKKSISSQPMFAKQQKSFVKVLQTETDLVRQFYQRFDQFKYATHDSAFKETEWKSMVMNAKKYNKSDNILEVQMSERVLQEEIIGCYENYRQQLEYKRYLQASLIAKVLVLIQPDYNSYLMLARAYAKMDRRKEAVQALSKSADLGLSDKSIATNSDFSNLTKEKKFSAVVQQIELNSQKIK